MGQDAGAPHAAAAKAATLVQEAASHKPLDYKKWENIKDSDDDEDSHPPACECCNPSRHMPGFSQRPPVFEARTAALSCKISYWWLRPLHAGCRP